MKCIYLAIILLSGSLTFAAGPAVLIEQVKPVGGQSYSLFGESKKALEVMEHSRYDDALSLRTKRRVGIGFSTLGQMGVYGLLVELNYAATDSFQTGFGGGPKLNSYTFQWKHLFGGRMFSPYTSLGLTHWYNAPGNDSSIEKTTPSFLAAKYLSEEEKRTGKFSKDFFVPSFGMQLNQLSGPYVGTTLFLEVNFLMELSQLSPTPTGSLGMMYYF